MLPEYYEFQNYSKVLSGKNALENIPYELVNLNCKRPIILVDKIVRKLGQLSIISDSMNDYGIDTNIVFDEIPPDSSVDIVNQVIKIYKESCCDGIIAIGGGSIIDTAKGARIVLSQKSDDIIKFMGSENIVRGEHIPFVVVPTTSGTGSEVTLVSVISNPAKNVKMEFISYNLLADVVVLDVRMTMTLPAKLTASTGMDALCHAVEAYTCIQKNPLSDAYAVSAIKLISENLVKAVKNGSDSDARFAMSNAAMMAGAAFSNSMVGMVHAIGHACGGVSHIPHGDAMTILLPYCMEYNYEKLKDLYGELLLYLAGPEIYASTPYEERATESIRFIKHLGQTLKNICDLPLKLSETSLKREDFEKIAETAVHDGAVIVNPVKVNTSDVINILEKAY